MVDPSSCAVGEPKAHEGLSPPPGWSDWPPPAWGIVRVSAALLTGAVILMCLDMLVYLRLWRLIVEPRGMPSPGRILSTIYTGLLPMALSGASCVVATWAAFRARGKYAVLAVVTAAAAAIIVAILVVMVLVQWCPVALLPAVGRRG
jgi:hypothetical protein